MWIPNWSKIGRSRCSAWNATPMSWMKRTGEVERLFRASQLSLPRGDTDVITWMSELTACSASYALARMRVYAAPATPVHFEPNCGWKNLGWLNSLPTTNEVTVGNSFAMICRNVANRSAARGEPEEVVAVACITEKMIEMLCSSACATARWSSP